MKKLTLEEVKNVHQAGHFVEARQGYLALLERDPAMVEALHWLGILYAEEGVLDQAQVCLEKAVALSPADVTLKLHLANILKAQGFYAEAVSLLLEVTRTHPTYVAAFNNLGTLYFLQEKYTEAIQTFQHVITLQPHYLDAYYNLGLALGKSKRFAEAANAFLGLIELSPQHAGARFQLGCLWMQQADYQKACEQFLLIEKVHPFHAESQMNLATCYLKMGLLAEAKTHYLKALELMPHDTQVLFNLGVISLQQGRTQEALEFYLQTVRLDNDHFDAHNNLGFIYLTQRDTANALLHYREALRLQPTNEAIRHTIHILTQDKTISTSPPDYITSLFDSYADHYDSHLVSLLQYQVPQLLYDLLQTHKPWQTAAWHILDLGCGTGLCGELLKKAAVRLVGVDLSSKMLEVAAAKRLYDELVEQDVVAFLADKKDQYDLVLAGDVLVYVGDLADLFANVSQALHPHGVFAFNAEIAEKDDYHMTESGRFAHSKHYLDRLAGEHGFIVKAYQAAILRTQNQKAVSGHLYLLEKA